MYANFGSQVKRRPLSGGLCDGKLHLGRAPRWCLYDAREEDGFSYP